MNKTKNTPLLPLRDIVVFPNMIVPLFVGREKSIKALNQVMKTDKKIVLVTQKNSEIDEPEKEDIYSYGCESKILQLLKLPDGTVKVLTEGVERVKILDFFNDKDYFSCNFENAEDINEGKEELYPLALTAVRKLEKLSNVNRKILQRSQITFHLN